ncbi:pirin family protein [Chitinophaga agrisoli]|uniref:Pirin family protein n=1 Tax=Chitinophaga agrisoli TaxID=2607653 RepID=A0A5B2VNE0_9BACT|nr:pirin family protein [Chitinophaga agrisoli]KAA2239832.1 pirin family protein [Chitinophaga agrisoli]
MSDLKYSRIVKIPGVEHGDFSAFQARHNAFSGLMSPVIGFDHFKMKEDVFGAHKHMHMSAVSYLFEDSIPYRNEDSMGTDLIITPGSLLWTWAGSGVVHHETPTVPGEAVHGLQLFLDIPPANRAMPPKSIYIPIETMPVVATEGASVKVVMGAAGDTVNGIHTPEPVTLLDIKLDAGKTTEYLLPAGWNGTVYVLSGALQVNSEALHKNDAISFGAAGGDEQVIIAADAASRLLLISGPPVGVN